MKTDFSKLPREEIEARITTMLLGELPADEAADLRDYISQDPELQKLHDNLKQTISLVAEASASAQEQPQQLSAGRREELLESFKMVRAPELAPKAERESTWRTWAALAAMIVFLLAVSGVMLLPSLAKSKSKGKSIAYVRGDEDADDGGKISVTGAVQGNVDFEKFASSNSRGYGEERGRATLKSSPAREAKLIEQKSLGLLNERLAEATKIASRAPDRPKAPAQATKIELPVTVESETRLGQNGQENNWAMNAGQTRGYGFGGESFGGVGPRSGGMGGYGGMPRDTFADAEGKNRPLARGGTLPSDEFAAGKDLSLAFGVTPNALAARPPQFDANSVAPSERFDSLAAIDTKKDGGAALDPATGLPSASAVNGQIDPLTGLPSAATNTIAQAGEEVSPMGGAMGGGGNMSMMYYMSNPELMKRYFPQMYSMMQKQQQAGGVGGAAGANAGFPGMPSLATRADGDEDSLGRKSADAPQMPTMAQFGMQGGYARYRNPATPSPLPKPASTQPQPEQKVALGTELNLVTADTEGTKQKEIRDLAENEAVRRAPEAIQLRGEQQNAGNTPAELERLKNLRASLDQRISREKIDASMPRGGGVEIVVLGEVIDELKLDQKWGEQEKRKPSRTEAVERLKKSVIVDDKGNGLLEIRARSEKGAEAADIANKVVEVYQKDRLSQRGRASQAGIEALGKQLAEVDQQIAQKEAEVQKLPKEPAKAESGDVAVAKSKTPAATPQPEISTTENAFSTFSLNVSDVSFKLAAASLEKGVMPEAATVRSEEFINAFDYHDAEPQGAPIGFVWERARYPFAQDRDLLRFSVKTAASGRQAGKPLNIVLLLDSSGSMERADRVRILNECLKTLATQLRPEDRISVVAFARTARLWVDGLPGNQANELPQRVGELNPEGGTNLEEAMKVAYETARKHFTAEGVNRVVLLTDGAANLGDVEPESLKRKVETERKKGIALDCFGIGWEGLNDELLEALSRNGDGRYGFVNTPEAAASEFAGQLAGALQVAASDVKVQVEWNPKRVTAYRQIGYAKHQLTKEQFRDNTVDAAEIGAAEAGNALYTVQVNAAGEGPLGTVRVRFKIPGTSDYREHAWPLNYEGASKALENSSYPLRLGGSASAFSEWLVSSPYATEVTSDRLLTILSGVPEHFAPDPRPKKLEWMIRQAKSLAGK